MSADTLTVYTCPDCGTICNLDTMDGIHHIHHIAERISAGELVPAGVCPNEDCRAMLCVEDADVPPDTLQIVAHIMRERGWVVVPPIPEGVAKPVHQMLAEVLASTIFVNVADDFVLQAVLNAANTTAALTPATLVMDEGPISKDAWIGAAKEIKANLTKLVRANLGLAPF